MNLRQLEILCEIIKRKSFSKAANAVFLSQPTLTEHIKSLEAEIDLKILDRLGREVVPTKAGEILYKYAQRILTLKAEVKQALEKFKGNLHGELSIGASTIPGEYILPHLLGKFREKFPQISLNQTIRDTREVVNGILDNNIELGMVGAIIGSAKLDYLGFVDDELVLAVPATPLWNKVECVSIENLKQFPFIFREEGSGTQLFITRTFDKFGLNISTLNVVARLGSTNAVVQAIKSGGGVSIVSKRAIEGEIYHNTINCLSINEIKLKRSFYIVTRKGKTNSPLCKAFINFLLDNKF